MAIGRRKLRVLLVEDSLLMAEQVEEMIKMAVPGAKITTFENADDANAKLRSAEFDLAVLDLNLKRGSGFHVLKAVKALPRPPTAVVMTNFGLPQYRDLALLMGADYFLDKAVGMDALTDIVQGVAAQHEIEIRNAPQKRSSDIEKNLTPFPGNPTHRLH